MEFKLKRECTAPKMQNMALTEGSKGCAEKTEKVGRQQMILPTVQQKKKFKVGGLDFTHQKCALCCQWTGTGIWNSRDSRGMGRWRGQWVNCGG